MIYADNAATTLIKPESVVQAVSHSLICFGDASRGAHAASLTANSTVHNTRTKIAELFSAGVPERVSFSANGTEALNTAIFGMFKTGDHIITTAAEHNSVLRPLFKLKASGVGVSIIDVSAKGEFEYDAIESQIKRNTRAIVCTHASNVTGTVADIKRIGQICRANGLMFVLDASLTAGLIGVDMVKHGVDVLCFTGHKYLYAPQGTGGICVRDGITVSPFKIGSSVYNEQNPYHPRIMPEALEAGTLNAHGIAGLNAGLMYIEKEGMSQLYEKSASLARAFLHNVKSIENVTVYGNDIADSEGMPCAPIVSINIGDLSSERAAAKLDIKYGIAARGGLHCAPLMHKALGTDRRGTVRFSFSPFNTMDDVDKITAAVFSMAQ